MASSSTPFKAVDSKNVGFYTTKNTGRWLGSFVYKYKQSYEMKYTSKNFEYFVASRRAH